MDEIVCNHWNPVETDIGIVIEIDIDLEIDIDYKISGSNKKGRWLQFKAENMREAIDSIGILYRRKETK